MAEVIKDRVREVSITTGTGDLTLKGAVLSYQSFDDAIGTTNTCPYTIVHRTANEWETGFCTVTVAAGVTTIARDTVLGSSNSGSAVDFSTGVKDVFVDIPANQVVYKNASNVIAGFESTGIDDNATETALVISADEQLTMALQPMVAAYNGANDTNATGNGATATIDFDVEVADQSGSFASDVYTADEDGFVAVSVNVRVFSISGASDGTMRIVTTNNSYPILFAFPDDTSISLKAFVIADMDAGDTLSVTLQISGMAGDTAGIAGGADRRTRIEICKLV